MTTDDLRTKYGKDTNNGCVTEYIWQMQDDYWTDDYVLWLEKQLLNQLNKQDEHTH